MKLLLPVVFIVLFSLGNGSCQGKKASSEKKDKWSVSSPDNSLSINVQKEQGKILYYVMLSGDTVIGKSDIGIALSADDFTNNLDYVGISTNKIDEHYTMVTGKRKENHNLANEMSIAFKNNRNTPIQIIFRAYNDGVAFRYRFPVVNKAVQVTNETTSFSIPLNGKAWVQSYGLPADWAPAYENMYSNGTAVDLPAVDSSGTSFASLFESNNHWLLITEAGLDEHFYGSHFKPNHDNGVYKISAPMAGEAMGLHDNLATASIPFNSPWRTVIIGKSLSTVVESNLVYHLSEPNKLGDVSWVKPGRSSWSWWSNHSSSTKYEALKQFVDLSKQFGWEYSLVDANWNVMKGGTIEQLAEYAKQQNVGLSLWYNSAGPHSAITEKPRDIMIDPDKRKAEFKKLRSWGVKGVKVDFFNSDKQSLIDLYLGILKDAAAEHIMVYFHGCTLPRGWARTYPNLMTMEAVHGAEQLGWDTAFARLKPQQDIIYGFTRNVVGSMDYTPVTFSNTRCCSHATSNSYELALSVLFESGIVHFADAAEEYIKTDENVHSFLKAVPVAWDDVKFIQGYPGKEFVLARRKEQDWYIAGVNGEAVSKNITPDLSFLAKGNYKLVLFRDGENNREIISEQISYKSGDPLSIKVLPNGGFTIWITRI